MTDVLITGAGGFVGRATSAAALASGHRVIGLVRRPAATKGVEREWVFAPADFVGLSDAWPADLRCDCVIHLAARVHVMDEKAADALSEYRATNVEGSLRVARAAAQHGATRFIFVSSVKALGDTEPGSPTHPWREDDPPAPADPYGLSKREAEDALFALGREVGIEVVVVRPPLVYGPGVRANFLQLMRAVARGWPLPLGAVDARRSIVFVDNLADALVRCTTHPAAAGAVLHVADGYDPTVAELARLIGGGLNHPARIWPVQPGLLRSLGRITGRAAQIDRLISPLRLDTSRIRTQLGWTPPYSLEQGIRATADWYRTSFPA